MQIVRAFRGISRRRRRRGDAVKRYDLALKTEVCAAAERFNRRRDVTVLKFEPKQGE